MRTLCRRVLVHDVVHMGRHVKSAYRKALKLLNLSEVSRQTGRALRTLQSYRRGERTVTEGAARELVGYLRKRAAEMEAAAAALEAALEKEAGNGET